MKGRKKGLRDDRTGGGRGVFMEEGDGLGQKLSVETAGDRRRGGLRTGEKVPATHSPAGPAPFRSLAGARGLTTTLKTKETHVHTHTFCVILNFCLYGCSFAQSCYRPQTPLRAAKWL